MNTAVSTPPESTDRPAVRPARERACGAGNGSPVEGPWQNFIDGTPRPPSTGDYTPLIDPCTGRAAGSAARSGERDVDAACRAAERAFTTWRTTTPAERQRGLLALAALLEQESDRFTAAECASTGKPYASTARDEVAVAVDVLRYFAGAARSHGGPTAGEYLEGHTSYVRREPLGVCAQMVPFNYPLLMAVWKVAPALATGNTCVLKPSHNTPVTTLMLAEAASRVLPPGVVNVVCGDRLAVSTLLEHPVPRQVSATASTPSGIGIAQSALQDVKRLHLGLGGKSPVLVLRDADVDAAAAAIADAGFFNAGQDCTAASRVLVAEPVRERFTAALVAQAASRRTGPPSDPAVFYGPLGGEKQLQRILTHLEHLPSHTEIATGGDRPHPRGWFLSPTVLVGVRAGDPLTTEELFGPVITVESYDDLDEAVTRVNSSPYGLACSVHGRDHATVMRTAAALDYGCVWVNTHLPLVSEMPHGGFKHSGMGKDLSVLAMDDLTRIKHVMHRIG
ncbi:aldehyde dehydrogenase family protein [Streptomyces sp. NPDC001941]|uniref:aldehyde dehydrogenase family protein n=1 Tax=Streptomyces sp. NPDC001941 TaxID=3154659 RepID=UPI00332CC42A